MSKTAPTESPSVPIPLPILVTFRGIGQIVFQENALTGVLFVLGIALGYPLLAAGIVAGAAIGTATAWFLKFDRGQLEAGIYGFNPALVGIATLFFFPPDPVNLLLLVLGCVVSTVLTMLVRTHVPIPTYTAPFIVTTWVIFLIGSTLQVSTSATDPYAPMTLLTNPKDLPPTLAAVLHGVGQIMFQDTLWAGVLFLVGLAISDREHAGWVLAGSLVGMLVAYYHMSTGMWAFEQGGDALNPERLTRLPQFEVVALGLYGYNATLAAVALYLWRRSLIAPIFGMLLTVPLTELVPLLKIPALTAPFVLATWIVQGLAWMEGKFLTSGKKA